MHRPERNGVGPVSPKELIADRESLGHHLLMGLTPQGSISRVASMSDDRTSPTLQREDVSVFAVLSLLVIVYLGFWLINGYEQFIKDGQFEPSDFYYFWLVSDLLRDGTPEIAYHPESYTDAASKQFVKHENQTVWPYPPHSWLFIWPLAYLPLNVSYVLWDIVGLGLLAWALYRTFGPSRWAVLFVLCSPVVAVNLRFGQSGFITAALLVAGLGLVERRPRISGVLFGLLTIKPTLGVLVPFALLAGRHWSAFVSAAVTTVCLIGASIALFGIDPWIAYLSVGSDFALELQFNKTGSIAIFIPTITRAVQLMGADLGIALFVQFAVGLGCIGMVTWVWRVCSDLSLRSAFLMSCVILVPPYALAYDMVMTTVAALILLQAVGRDGGKTGERSVVLLVWLLPASMILFTSFLDPIKISLAPPMLMALGAVLLRRCLRERRTTPAVIAE